MDGVVQVIEIVNGSSGQMHAHKRFLLMSCVLFMNL